MQNFMLIGKQFEINNRNMIVEDIIGKKVILRDEYGEELETSLDKIMTNKMLVSIKFNLSGMAMIFYQEGDEIKHIVCIPNNKEELEEFVKNENIEYSGDIMKYNESDEKLVEDSTNIDKVTINKIIHNIAKNGYTLIKTNSGSLEFKSKKKLDNSLLSESQIELNRYNEMSRLEEIMSEIEDKLSVILTFDLKINNVGNYGLIVFYK